MNTSGFTIETESKTIAPDGSKILNYAIVPEPDNVAISFLLSESGVIFFRVTIPPGT